MTDTANPDDEIDPGELSELRELARRLEQLLGVGPEQQVATDSFGNPGTVAAGELIESAWGNSVGGRVVRRFPTKADLDAWASPPAGALAVAGTVVYFRLASGWRDIYSLDIPGAGVTSVGSQSVTEVLRVGNSGTNSRVELPYGVTVMKAGSDNSTLVLAGGATGEPYIRQVITGVGNPKWFFDIGSRSATAQVVIRFLEVNRIEATVPWPVASTRAIKTNIAPLAADVTDLHPVSYQRTDGIMEGRTLYGFVVEDLLDDMPEAVTYGGEDGTDPTGYMTEVILSAAVATIQALERRVAALEAARGA